MVVVNNKKFILIGIEDIFPICRRWHIPIRSIKKKMQSSFVTGRVRIILKTTILKSRLPKLLPRAPRDLFIPINGLHYNRQTFPIWTYSTASGNQIKSQSWNWFEMISLGMAYEPIHLHEAMANLFPLYPPNPHYTCL